MFWKKRQREPKDRVDDLLKRLPLVAHYWDDWEEAEEIVEQLIAIGEPAIKPMIYKYLGDPGLCYGMDYTEEVAIALGKMGDSAFQELIIALRDPDPYVRHVAARALGDIGNPAAIEALEWALWEDHSQSAIIALGQIGGDRAARHLLKALDSDHFEKSYVINWLGETGSDLVFDVTVNALEDENPEVRRSAVFALRRLGDPRAREHLVPLLEDPHGHVRRDAAYVLATQFHDPRAAPVLTEDFDHKITSIRGAVAMNIAISGSFDYTERIYRMFTKDDDPTARLFAANALILLDAKYADEAAQLIRDSLKSKDDGIRTQLVEILRPQKHQFTLEWLMSLINDPNPFVRYFTAIVLGELGDSEIVETLRTWGNTEQHRIAKKAITRAIEKIESRATSGTSPDGT